MIKEDFWLAGSDVILVPITEVIHVAAFKKK